MSELDWWMLFNVFLFFMLEGGLMMVALFVAFRAKKRWLLPLHIAGWFLKAYFMGKLPWRPPVR